MGKGSKIKPTEIRAQSNYIKPTEADPSVHVSFNFKNLAEKRKKFEYSQQPSKYFLKLLERLTNVSRMSKKEMIIDNRNSLRCHQINFSDSGVSEMGFGLAPDLDDDAWQIQISSNMHGRIHGYFVENVFYVVWLDPNHNLYSI